MHARLARDRGVKLVIDSDAHSPAALGNAALGRDHRAARLARAGDVLNTRPVDEFRASLRRAADGAAERLDARRQLDADY